MVRCKICNDSIVDEELKHTYYDPEYPSIDIGPYCSRCIGTIRICSCCHEPHQLDVSIKYFNSGKFYCNTCSSDLDFCDFCNRETPDLIKKDGFKYCKECFNKYFVICDCCKELINKRDLIIDAYTRAEYPGLFRKYNKCCKGCFDKKKSRFLRVEVGSCNNCHSFYRIKGTNTGYCNKCYGSLPTCGECGKRHHLITYWKSDDSLSATGSVYICESCKNNTDKCDCCGRLTKNPTTHKVIFKTLKKCQYCEDSKVGQCSVCLRLDKLNNGICHKCSSLYINGNKCNICGRVKDDRGNCRVCGSTHIYNYSFKPLPFFMYDKSDISNKNTIFFGIENEVCFSSEGAKNEALKSLYEEYSPTFLTTKTDASISGPGFEIVTQPMTFTKFFERDISGMFFSTMKKSDSCGMHVHVGRDAFLSDAHLFKICQFIHKNTKFSDYIAERTVNHYSGDFEQKISKAVKASKRGGGYRNLRVNLINKVTVEFRMFSGATTEVQMRRRIEYLHSLIEWTKNISLSESSVEAFTKYVNSNKKLYPNLVTFIDNYKK